MEKQEFKCKECDEKVRCASGPAVFVAATKGATPGPHTIPVRLTCKKGHTNTYDIKEVDIPFDGAFWTEKAKKMVENSGESVANSADKLKDLLAWVWPIYVAGAGIGIALSKASLPLFTVILAAVAGLLLIAAYALVSSVHVVRAVAFDPKSAFDVEEHYQELVESKYRRYRYSLLCTVIAVIAVMVALFSTSLSQKSDPEKHAFRAYAQGQDVAITGQAPGNTNFLIKVVGATWQKEVPYVTPESGKIETRISLDPGQTTVDLVVIRWTDKDKVMHTLEGALTR